MANRKKLAFTVEDFLTRSAASEESIREYEAKLRRIEGWVNRPLGEASKRDIETLKKQLRGMRSGPQHAVLLRMFYRAAGRPEIVEMLKLKQRLARLAPSDILTLPEVNDLIKAATTLRDRALIVMLWETGARIHEILTLNLEDLQQRASPENGGRTILQVFFRKVKVAGEEHSSYILEGVDHILGWVHTHPDPQPSSPIFVSYGHQRLSKHRAERMVAATARRAGLTKRVYPHLFRHSRATHLLRLGVPEVQVKKLLGWAPGSPMLARYSHLVSEDAYAALLRAKGLEAPKQIDMGTLISAEADLKPVVALNPPPGRAKEPVERLQKEVEDLRRFVEQLAANPGALETLRRALEAFKPA